MTLAPSRPVMSALRHRPGLAAVNTGPGKQGDTPDETLTQQTLLSLSKSLSSSRHHSRRNLRPCPCTSWKPSAPEVVHGRVTLPNASPRMPGFLFGGLFYVWARGRTRLFVVWSFSGRVVSSLLLAAALSLPTVGQRTLC